MADVIMDLHGKIEKYGVVGIIGLILTIAPLFWMFPISSIEELKNLDAKQFVFVILEAIGFVLILIALFRKNSQFKIVNNFKQSGLLKDEFDYPEKIERAIISQFYNRNFYKEKITFDLKVENIREDKLQLTSELTYYVTNRANQVHNWLMEYKYKYENAVLIEALFDETIYKETPDIIYGRGIRISQPMLPGQRSKVKFIVTEQFRLNDSEFFTSYHPATDLTLNLENNFNNILFDFEILYFSQVNPVHNENLVTVKFNDGILPFQGVRLHWKKK